MRCTPNRMVETSDLRYFCIDSVRLGDPVFAHEIDVNGCSICTSFKKKKGDFIGISLYHVVDVDSMTRVAPHNCVSHGSKITVLTKGWLVYQLDPSWKIPYGQKLYCCPKTGEITWRKSDIKIGKAVSAQDEDGFIKVEIKV